MSMKIAKKTFFDISTSMRVFFWKIIFYEEYCWIIKYLKEKDISNKIFIAMFLLYDMDLYLKGKDIFNMILTKKFIDLYFYVYINQKYLEYEARFSYPSPL